MKERDTHLSSRRAFLGKGVLAGGALAVGTLALPTVPAHALDFSYGDARLLSFLLKVQELQSDFFTRASMTQRIQGFTISETNALNTIAHQDGEQKRWCKQAIRKFAISQGSLPATMSGGFTRKRYIYVPMTSRESILRQALRLKKASASAWTGAAGEADAGQIASAFAALAGIQNRHCAMLAEALGEASPMAMAPALSVQQASKELGVFGLDTAL